MNAASEYWSVFDTETTDLVGVDLLPLQKQPRIIEFSGIVISLNPDGTGDEEHILDFMCNPGTTISEDAVRITGITQAMLEDKHAFTHYTDQVKEFFSKGSHRAAHNLVFDEKMVDGEFRRLNLAGAWKPEKQRRICTCERTEHFVGRRASLSDLHEKLFGEKFDGAHRALVDVRALIRCIRELRRLDEL